MHFSLYLILMKKLALLFIASFLLAACSTNSSDSHIITFVEKSNEVLLTDLPGLSFSLVCRVNSESKNCGIVFDGFDMEDFRNGGCAAYGGCTYYETYSGFKDASILSLQVKDENTGKAKSLISYFQKDVPYSKGDANIPTVMALNNAKDSTIDAVTLSGYYIGEAWVKHDTTIAIKDTLFANADGKLSFSVVDAANNRAALSIDVSGILNMNNAKTIVKKDVFTESVRKTRDYWRAGARTITVEPLEINFEARSEAYLKVYPLSNELILSGGVNDSTIDVSVGNYEK